MFNEQQEIQIIRIDEVVNITGLSKGTIFNKMIEGHTQFDYLFPKSLKLGKSSSGWLKHEILDWIEFLAKQRFVI